MFGYSTRKYRYLRGRLTQLGILHEELAAAIKISPSAFSAKLRGKSPWKDHEMYQIMDIIKAPYEQLHLYFPRDGIDLPVPA